MGACVWDGEGGEGEYRPLLEPVRSQNCKIPPVHELEKKEKVMVSY